MANHDEETPREYARDEGDMRATASRMSDQAKQAAHDVTGRAKEQGRAMFDEHKGTAADQMEGVAGAFRETAGRLQGEGRSEAGRYIGMAAERLEGFGRQLRDKDAESLLREAEDLGRRAPGALFAGAVAVGFLLSRFLRSSSQHRYASSGRGFGLTSGSSYDDRHDDFHSDLHHDMRGDFHDDIDRESRSEARSRMNEDLPVTESPTASDERITRVPRGEVTRVPPGASGAAGTGGIEGVAGSSANGNLSVPPSSGGGTQPSGGTHGNR